jgi:hypothetical protein
MYVILSLDLTNIVMCTGLFIPLLLLLANDQLQDLYTPVFQKNIIFVYFFYYKNEIVKWRKFRKFKQEKNKIKVAHIICVSF